MVCRYREYGVNPALAGYVACYWTLDVATKAQTCHPVLPDGCIDLLFESRAATLDVVGTMTRTLWAHECGPTQLVGARFKAGGAVPFLRDRADLLTDNVAKSETIFGRAGAELKERLLECRNLQERVRLLERFLMRRLAADLGAVDSRIAWATSKLLRDPGSRIEALASELGMSRQYIRRLFLQHAGLSPKAFGRVARLGRLVKSLRSSVALADAALVSGYADQAHMTHEFRSMVGVTPAIYRDRYFEFPFIQDGATAIR